MSEEKEIALYPKVLISIEGYDNAGKTTFIKAFKQKLEEITDYKVHILSTADTEFGKIIRSHYKNKDEISKEEELKLHMNSIDELNVRRYIGYDAIPAPRGKHIYIIDRYVDSTLAYQLNVELSPDNCLAHWSLPHMHMLDYTIYLELDRSLYIERLKQTKKIEHPEERDMNHYEKVMRGYYKVRPINARHRCQRECYSICSRNLVMNFERCVEKMAEQICFTKRDKDKWRYDYPNDWFKHFPWGMVCY